MCLKERDYMYMSMIVQDHLGEVVFVELPEANSSVSKEKSFGAVESVKATSEILSPISGEVIEVNTKLTESPGLVSFYILKNTSVCSVAQINLISRFFICVDQLKPLWRWLDDKGETEQPRGVGSSDGSKGIHQVLRRRRRCSLGFLRLLSFPNVRKTEQNKRIHALVSIFHFSMFLTTLNLYQCDTNLIKRSSNETHQSF